MSRPPDLAEDGNWNEWRRVVLSGINRIDGDLRQLDREMRTISTNVALLKQGETEIEELEERVLAMERIIELGGQRNEDRKWLIGMGVLVVASILFPSLRVILFGGSG